MPVQPEQHPTLGISAGSVQDLDRFIAATGTHPEVLDVFEQWSRNRPLDPALVESAAERGARLSVTWEPWDPDGSHTDQPRYTLASLIGGTHDAYIDMFADSVKDLPYVVTIRLMHEMNGNWYPWGVGANGNRVEQFVLAWRHVHDRFAARGVTNVEWLWAPNAVYTGSAPLAPLYPGDAYVDAVGVSNYNWGEHSRDGFATQWRTFGSLFDASIAQLRAITRRPLWIAEVGSSNLGGSKAAWLAAMLREVPGRPEITGVIWFDHVDDGAGVDWRIETEPDAADAWRAGFSARPTPR
jgi:mannan endo-1,4-beta-mannosidase